MNHKKNKKRLLESRKKKKNKTHRGQKEKMSLFLLTKIKDFKEIVINFVKNILQN